MPTIHARRAAPFPYRAMLALLAILAGLSLGLASQRAYAADQQPTRIAALVERAQGPTKGSATGLPLPRFVSLKFSETNLRVGPGTKYGVAWTYRRKGLPVEIIQEFDRWRRIQDSDGSTGWVLHSLLSAHRTALIAPWRRDLDATAGADLSTLALLNGKAEASESARTVARLQPGLQVDVSECRGGWCAVNAQSIHTFIPQDKLWGVYGDERVGQ